MRYAILSDIHGNLHALEAVLEGIRTHRVDKVLVLGDYLSDLPLGNEVLNLLRAIDNAVVIRGNREEYILSLEETDARQWHFAQYMPLYHCYQSLSGENMRYIRQLPASVHVRDEHVGTILLAHAMRQYMTRCDHPLLRADECHRLLRQDIPYPAYRSMITDALCMEKAAAEDAALLSRLSLPLAIHICSGMRRYMASC